MCIGLPMRVVALRPGHATVERRGERREVNAALVGPLRLGDLVLVFLDSAREVLDERRAAEVDATLDLLQAALHGGSADEPVFELPSRMSPAQLAALAGQPFQESTP